MSRRPDAMTRRRARQGPRRRRGRVHPLAMSLIAIAAAGFVIFYAFNQALPFTHQFTLHALVSNSVNVRQDSPVRIAGIDVGTVTGTAPAGNATEINFSMNQRGLPVHTDATMRIRGRLFLEGAYYLDLDPGTPEAPIAGDGFTIPLQQTSSPVQFYSVLSTFNAAARSSLEHLLATLNEGFGPPPGQSQSAGGAGGLKVAIPALTPVLRDVAWVTRAARGVRPGEIETLLRSGSEVTGTLAGSEPQLVSLIHDLNLTSQALASTDGALGSSVVGLDQTLRTAPASLAAVDRALPPVSRLAAVLDPSLRVSPPIIDTITRSVEQLAQVVSQPTRGRLLRSLNATFVQFPSILTTLAGAFPITKQVTDCLRTHVTPILNAQVPDGSLSSGQPVWKEFVHFLPSLSGASGGFDANGHYVRVIAGAGNNSLGTSGILGTLGSLPLLGQIVGSGTPGGGTISGVSPRWIGTLTDAAYRPDVACASQTLPRLSTPATSPDLTPRPAGPPRPLTPGMVRGLRDAGQRRGQR